MEYTATFTVTVEIKAGNEDVAQSRASSIEEKLNNLFGRTQPTWVTEFGIELEGVEEA